MHLTTEIINNIEITDRLTNIEKYKQTIPVSPRLNQFIENKISILESEGYKFNYIDNHRLTLFRSQKTLNIWTGNSDCTIFGNPEINHKFRAWYRYIHSSTNLDYDMVDEIIVAEMQKNELPQYWEVEKRLIQAEVVGQAQYYYINNNFVQNQRLFARDYMLNPLKALNTKY